MLKVLGVVLALVVGLVVVAGLLGPDEEVCLEVSPNVLAALKTGLPAGAQVEAVRAVRSNDYDRFYFVTARVNGSYATWATNRIGNDIGVIYAAGDEAVRISGWGDGRRTDAAFGPERHGWSESRTCSSQARG